MGLKIMRRKKLLIGIGLISLLILMNISVSTIFIGMLLGLLFVPPVLVSASILKEGKPVIVKLFNDLIASGKGFLVISISKETITLQPEYK